MFKNLTPSQLAFYTSCGIGLLSIPIMYLYGNLSQSIHPVLLLLVLSLLILLISLVLIRYIIRQYIFRRVKLIYKTIRRSKASFPEKNIPLDSDVLGDVERDVMDWAQQRDQEIESLKSLENYRRDFLGNISHELKTPVFSIQGYIETLLEGGLSDDRINIKYLNKSARNVERLITIIEDLESISRLESGEMELDLQKFDVKQLAQEVFDDLEMPARRKGIQLQFKEGADKGFQVVADRENVRQVFMNLLMNSIKYGREKGLTKIGFYDMDQNILIEVADNGLGIEEKHLNHLFDRFYRVDKSRSRLMGGSGLGLSIVKHILEAHGQSINVRSTPGQGSTFGFTLEKA